jgi:hypothetical protein
LKPTRRASGGICEADSDRCAATRTDAALAARPADEPVVMINLLQFRPSNTLLPQRFSTW